VPPRLTVDGETVSEMFSPLVTVKVVVAVFVFPAPSVAVRVIVYVPGPTLVPAAGFCVTVTGPQLSLAAAPATTLGIVDWNAWTLVGAGAIKLGAVLSKTTTVCCADVLLPAASVAV